MGCPFFVDCTRECVKEIKVLPPDTFDFCATPHYDECPFYRSIKRIGPLCDGIANCSVYHSFQAEDFPAFVEMTRQYCLSENNVNCRRFILKKRGGAVPPGLLPDGRIIE